MASTLISMYIGYLFWISVGLCLAAPGAIILQAWNVREFWSLWLIGLGILVGGVLGTSTKPWPYAVSAAAGAVVLVAILVRGLPIHSMGWSGLEKVEFTSRQPAATFTLIEPEELKKLEHFGARGRYRTMHKSGYGAEMRIWTTGHGRHWFIHGNAFGDEPGGFIQTVFVPSETGFVEWFEALILKHGGK